MVDQMMGPGKSTVSQALATRMGRPFLDTDLLVEDALGLAVAEVSLRRLSGIRGEGPC